jgi:hypothetical protein
LGEFKFPSFFNDFQQVTIVNTVPKIYQRNCEEEKSPVNNFSDQRKFQLETVRENYHIDRLHRKTTEDTDYYIERFSSDMIVNNVPSDSYSSDMQNKEDLIDFDLVDHFFKFD